MRIAFVSFDFGEYCVRHVNALSAQSATEAVMLMLPKGKAGTYEQEIDAAVEQRLFQRPRFRQPLRQWISIRSMLNQIDAFSPDVVHFQGAHLWFNFALPRLKKYPLVVTAHNVLHHLGDRSSRKTPQWVMNYGYRQADQLVVHGQVLAEQLESHLAFPRERVHVIPMIALGRQAAEHIETDPRMVLFFGRIWRYKGLEYLIRAEPYISEQIPDARIVIAGEGEDFTPYRRLMRDPSRFEVHNERVSDEKRERLFAQAAVVALPYVGGTQSGVIPIAFQHAKPVVVTGVGAFAEAVDDGVTGLIVPPRNEQALATAIIQLLNDPAQREQMGRLGQAALRATCSEATIGARLLEVYHRAIFSHDPDHAVGVA